jgi:hypothetical protein
LTAPPRKLGAAAQLAERVQRYLEQFYGLEQAPSIEAFLRCVDDGARESVRIRDAADGEVEIEVLTPALSSSQEPDLDTLCQLIEGVSHFVYVAERARRRLPTTQLELELQAEVDKYVLLAWQKTPFRPELARRIHARLYERVRFCHDEGTEEGDRYRLANGLAARFVHRLERLYLSKGHTSALRGALHRFYGMGQADKLQLARAA